MTALFRTRLEQHGSGNLRDVVGGVRRVEGGESSNLLGAFLLCSQQSASINKGLAVPRSILIFKLTAERIRAFMFPLAIGRERKRGGRIHPRSHTRSSALTLVHVYVHALVRACMRVRLHACVRARLLAHTFG